MEEKTTTLLQQEDPWNEQLLNTVQDAWHLQYDIDSFRHLLRRYLPILQNPQQKKPDKKDEEKVLSGKVILDPTKPPITFGGDSPQQVIQFSRAVNLNEIEAANLFYISTLTVGRALISATREQMRLALVTEAYRLHFFKRHNLLVALLDLILMYQSHEFPEEMMIVVNDFVTELLRSQFVTHLIQLLRDLLDRKDRDSMKENALEMWYTIQVVFYLFHKHEATLYDTRELLKLLRYASEELLNRNKDPSLTFMCWIMVCTLIKLLDMKALSIQNETESEPERDGDEKSGLDEKYGGGEDWDDGLGIGGGGGRRESRREFIRELNKEAIAEGQWKNATFEAIFKLSWSLFLRQCDSPTYKLESEVAHRLTLQALAPKVNLFTHLESDFVISPRLHREARNDIICDVLGKFFNQLLTYCHPRELEELRKAEVRELLPVYQKRQLDSIFSLPRGNCSAFISVLAHICKMAPQTTRLLLENRRFDEFLEPSDGWGHGGVSLSISLESPLLASYVQLLESLAENPDGRFKVYGLVRDSHRLNWEMIFSFLNRILHNFLPHVTERVYGYPQHLRPRPTPHISPRQESVLQCMIRLIKAVNQILLQSSEYKVIDILFGLLGCRFGPSLKAEIFKAITALAQYNSEVSLDVWKRLEHSQILPTRPLPPTTDLKQQSTTSGILYDLEEIEQPQKEYPLTIAFSELILTLLYSAPIPSILGAEYRRPGVQPYINFLREHVFLKLLHPTRQFLKPDQRWIMAEICLAIFVKFITEFDPDQDDFLISSDEKKTETSSLSSSSSLDTQGSPGFTLMRQLLERDAFSSQVFAMILRTYTLLTEEDSGIPSAEGALFFALKFLHESLERQDIFIQKLRIKETTASPHQLSTLLRVKEDVVISIAKAVGYLQLYTQTPPQILVRGKTTDVIMTGSGGVSPNEDVDTSAIAYCSANIILHLSNVREGSQLIHLLEKKRESDNVVGSFAIQLKHVEPSLISDENNKNNVPTEEPDERNRARLVILEILVTNILLPETNLAHLLLGFNITGRIEESDLNAVEPRRRLLDTIISLVQKPRFSIQFPSLTESCLELFYRLCSNPLTSKPFISFIQHRHERLFFNLLDNIPMKIPLERSASFLQQRGWLLKTIALELHLTSRRAESWDEYIDHALRKLGFLNGEEEKSFEMNPDDIGQRQFRMLDLLDTLRINVPPNPEPIPPIIGGIKTAQCRKIDPSKPHTFQFDVKRLYLLAHRVYNTKESEKIATNALKWNKINTILSACRDAFDGWKQTVEIVLYECFSTQQDPDRYEIVLFDLILALLKNLSIDDRIWMCLGESMSAVALTLMVKIREQVSVTAGRRAAQSHGILELILKAIPTSRHHLTRAHLYATFMNYIQYTRDLLSSPQQQYGGSGYGEQELDISLPLRAPGFLEQQRYLESKNIELLEAYTPSLLSLVCEDAIDGRARLRSMALVFLTSLLSDDPRHYWLNHLKSKENVSQLIMDLKQRDQILKTAVVDHQLRHYEQILNYESLMCFLLKMSETQEGTRTLLEFDVIHVLCGCRFLRLRPESSISALYQAPMVNIPTPMQRHLQLLIPALQLILCMFSSAQSNLHLHRHTLEFIKSNRETILSILKDISTPIYLNTLKTLKLTLGVFYHLYSGPLYQIIESRREIDSYEHYFLRLLRVYTFSDRDLRLRQIGFSTGSSSSSSSSGIRENKNQRRGSIGVGGSNLMEFTEETNGNSEGNISIKKMHSEMNEICRHLLGIIRIKIKHSTTKSILKQRSEAINPVILFLPSFEDSYKDGQYLMEEERGFSTLFTLKDLIRKNVERSYKIIDQINNCEREIDLLPSMSPSDLSALSRRFLQLEIPDNVLGMPATGSRSHQQLKRLAHSQLVYLMNTAMSDFSTSLHIIETALYVLYHHVEVYYFLRQPIVLEESEDKEQERSPFHLDTLTMEAFRKESERELRPMIQGLMDFLTQALTPPVGDEKRKPARFGGGSDGLDSSFYPSSISTSMAPYTVTSSFPSTHLMEIGIDREPLLGSGSRRGKRGIRGMNHNSTFIRTLINKFKKLFSQPL